MSKVAEFYAKVIADEALRNKAAEFLNGKTIEELGDGEIAKLVEFAGEAGYAVTVAEIKEYLASGARDLSDEAMDAVAGGKQKGYVVCRDNAKGNKDVTTTTVDAPSGGGGKKK